MIDLAEQMTKDRRQRNAAWALCKTDVAFIREDLNERSLGARITDRISEGAGELADEAAGYAGHNPYKVAGGLAAVLMWFARGLIIDTVADLFRDDDDREGEESDKEP